MKTIRNAFDKSNTLLTVGALSLALSLTACQKEPEEQPVATDTAAEPVPMSAEPAEPNDTVIITDDTLTDDTLTDEVNDPNAIQVADDTVADVATSATQIIYVCTPTLKVNAVYNMDAKNVTLNTDLGNLSLDEQGEGAYAANTGLDGNAGLTQWRLNSAERDAGVLRVANNDNDITTYECSAAG